jgi:hypothetical protein
MPEVASLPTINRSLVNIEYLTQDTDFSKLLIDPKTFGIISKDAYQKVKISWPKQLDAASYNVYGSPNPLNRFNRLNEKPIDDAFYVFDLPVMPETVQLYFWVTSVNGIGGERYLAHEGATNLSSSLIDNNFISNPLTPMLGIPVTHIINAHMQNIILPQIRQRLQFELENDGEDVLLFIRRFVGAPCKCTDMGTAQPGSGDPNSVFSSVFTNDDDRIGQKTSPDYQGRSRCLVCFGTGIVGGYYPSFKIKIRYGAVPITNVVRTRFGWQNVHNFSSWTLWYPHLTQHDVIVRPKDGERYTVNEPGESEFRGLPLHQEMNFQCLQQTDIKQQISDELIYKVTHEKEFIPTGTKIFG